MMDHLVTNVAFTKPDLTYFCKCGEVRVGSKAMAEHENATRFESLIDAALTHRKVWILGREVQL